MLGFHPQAAAKRKPYANGGKIVGKGTGTSDSIKKDVPAGTYIMPADSTKQFGAEALGMMGRDVPVAVSNGEYQMPPEQVHDIGVQTLNAMRDATHAPVGARGFNPEHMAQADKAPRQFFADGGAPVPSWGDRAKSWMFNAMGENTTPERVAENRQAQAAREMQAKQAPVPTPVPRSNISQYAGGDALKRRMATIDGYANGGNVGNDLDRWQAAADQIRASNERIAANQGRMTTQRPDGSFDEGKLAQAANLVRESRERIAAMQGGGQMAARGFKPERQYLAVGGVTGEDELARWRDAANQFAQTDARAQEKAQANTRQIERAAENTRQVQEFQKASTPGSSWVSAVKDLGDGLNDGADEGGLHGAGMMAGAMVRSIPKTLGGALHDVVDNPFTRGFSADSGQSNTQSPPKVAYEAPAVAAAAKAEQDGQAGESPSAANAPAPSSTSADPAIGPQPATGTAVPYAAGAYSHGKGNYSDNPNGMGFNHNFTGQPSAQNDAAMSALASRSAGQVSGMAAQQMQQVQQPRGFDAQFVPNTSNDWQARNELRNAATSANSITNNGGNFDQTKKGRSNPAQQKYTAMLEADNQARTAGYAANNAALNANAALAREGMQQQGENQRAADNNALEAQRIGIAGQEAVFNRGLKGFDVQSAQRRQQIQGMMDAAKTPEERKAIAERFPDVYAGNKGSWKGLALQGGTDAMGNKTEGVLVAVNEDTGDMKRFGQDGGASTLPVVNSKADMDKLPKGAQFIGVDGKVYTKN